MEVSGSERQKGWLFVSLAVDEVKDRVPSDWQAFKLYDQTQFEKDS